MFDGAEVFVVILRIVVAIVRRPRWLLGGIFGLGLLGAVVHVHNGWLLLVAIALLVAAFIVWRSEREN